MAVANPSKTSDASDATQLVTHLQIDPVIARADALVVHIEKELPTHPGLARVARTVAQVARNARDVSRRLKHPIGLHRLPAIFLTISLIALFGWLYWQFIHTSTLRLAVPERDAIQLKNSDYRRVRVVPTVTVGSRASIELLHEKKVDLAFIQGGIDLPKDMLHLELHQSELVLLFVRERVQDNKQIRRVLTSAQDQGSHSLAKKFMAIWQIGDHVEYVFDWRKLTADSKYVIAEDIDAIFVVKDPMSSELDGVAARLSAAGFRLVSPDIGAMQLRLEYLKEYSLRPGFLDPVHHLPTQGVNTYSVATYLVARPDLTSHQLAMAQDLVDHDERFPGVIEPDLSTASEMAQGVEAVLGILVYISLTFLALLGLDAITYRRCFHELNTLVSLISMHQSSKDVISGTIEQKTHNVQYLSMCSDLLGLIAVITGYYTQENSSLMYNRLADIIHERCNGLKINIQLKILHASLNLPLLTNDTGSQTVATRIPSDTPEGKSVPDSLDQRGA